LGGRRLIDGTEAGTANWKLHTSRDGIAWAERYDFGTTPHRHVEDFRWNQAYFYACQDTDGTTAPILVSTDYGNTFEAKVGNWGAVGAATEIWCCAVLWVAE